MALEEQEVSIDSGDDETLFFTLTIPSTRPAFTGDESFFFTVKTYLSDDDADALISKTSDDGVSVTSVPDKEVAVVLSRADTEPLSEGADAELVFDLKMLDTVGKLSRVAKGKVLVSESVRQHVD